ncbi:uncharacterized protein [Eurosta solidaginis]|uniref:uncharacterized protein n=1 Tax=Eurosta solidaginis TaxID=178769 RepID=UPI00353098F4
MVTQINDIQLIKLVKEHPILYDKILGRKPGSASMKDDIWHKLSQQMNCSERACITRWKSLRDRFVKVFKKAQENPEETVNWDMFEHLLFLRDHDKNGTTFVNIKYEPKIQKRGRKPLKRNHKESRKQECEDSDVDPEELIKNQQLIELVKEHPVLYDKYKIRDSKNLTLKNDAWRDISESMGISEEECYKRWKKIRERFSREYRHQKLYPDHPVTWVYFQDLLFLEEHYRKGIPLPVDAIIQKRKAKMATESAEDNTLDTDCGFTCVKDERDDELDLEDIDTGCTDLNASSLNELIILPSNNIISNDDSHKMQLTIPSATSSHERQQNKQDTTNIAKEPEKKLTALITGIQEVLNQSQDCLKSLQKQNVEHKRELQANAFASLNTQGSMLQKVNVLLDGLDVTQRAMAERRIVQFLCECQIKTLNNDDIEDVSYTQIH